MNHLKFIGGILLIFLLIGPIFPMPTMVLLDGSFSELLESILIYPLAVMVGSVFALQSSAIFIALIILFRWTKQRYGKFAQFSPRWLTTISGGIAGAILFLVYGLTMENHAGIALFFLPSILCGMIYGALFKRFLDRYLSDEEKHKMPDNI